MSAHLRMSLSSLLLELMSCDARAPVPIGDVGKDGDELPMSRENAALVDVIGAEKNVVLFGSSTQIVLMTGLSTTGSLSEKLRGKLSFKLQVVLSMFWFSLVYVFVSSHLCFSFFCKDSHIGRYVTLHKLICPRSLYTENGIMGVIFFVLSIWRAQHLS